MADVMVDIESLGLEPDAPVLTIGACEFDIETGRISDEFYARMDRDKAQKYGRTSISTLRWWLEQDAATRAEAWEGREDPRAVARAFRTWLASLGPRNNLYVWGNGSVMDIVILEHWYRRLDPQETSRGYDYPWPFWNIMDMRTAMRRGKLQMPRTRPAHVQHHNALHDARYQVEWLCKAWNAGRSAPLLPPTPQMDELSFNISAD